MVPKLHTKKSQKNMSFWALFALFWANENLPEKSSSVTFECLWSLNFILKKVDVDSSNHLVTTPFATLMNLVLKSFVKMEIQVIQPAYYICDIIWNVIGTAEQFVSDGDLLSRMRFVDQSV